MNLYKIFQNVNIDCDTYDTAIVAAESEEQARLIHPNGDQWDGVSSHKPDSWCDSSDVKVELIGIAKEGTKQGVILASFNAG